MTDEDAASLAAFINKRAARHNTRLAAASLRVQGTTWVLPVDKETGGNIRPIDTPEAFLRATEAVRATASAKMVDQGRCCLTEENPLPLSAKLTLECAVLVSEWLACRTKRHESGWEAV
jgi:hypothetical protein